MRVADIFYRRVVKPVLFRFDAEAVHDAVTAAGEVLGRSGPARKALGRAFCYEDSRLRRSVAGIEFSNPIGLAAGFDYDGRLAAVLEAVGFGFHTVGTVTAKAYAGNPPPRLGRLPRSGALLVNKGFKSEGAAAVARRLDNLASTIVVQKSVLGVSVGSSNLPEVNTISKAIDDYMVSFDLFKSRDYVRYFELNISCPNTAMTESFSQEKNFLKLVRAIAGLKVKQPIFVKMANELGAEATGKLVKGALDGGMTGVVLANLIKDRSNRFLNKTEIMKLANMPGNFSGRPAREGSDRLIAYVRRKFGRNCVIIGCGGVFSAEDAYEKIRLGADLVAMVTGLVYKGPGVVREINRGLAELTGNRQ